MGRRYPFEPFQRNPFENPIQDIRIPRPPRRFWVGVGFFGLAVLVFFLVGPVVQFITETQWFEALGLKNVYLTRLGLQAELFVGSLLLAFLFAAANVVVALRLRSGPSLRAVGIRRTYLRSATGLLGLGGAVLVALILSGGAGTQWQSLILFMNYHGTGLPDPVFNLDVSFYMLTLPFLRAIVNWSLGLIFMTALLTAVVYTWRGDSFELHLPPRALGHLSVLAALLLLTLGAGTYIGRYELLSGHTGFVYGAGFADVNARLPVAMIRTVLAAVLALVLLANLVIRRQALPVVVAGVYVAGAIVGGIYPGVVQRLVVAPAESSQEQPYIQREIAFTRHAYGLDNVRTVIYGGEQNLTKEQVEGDRVTIDNLRLWDAGPLLETYQQLQSFRTYYDFNEINLDRYTVNGVYQQLEISARELNTDKLQAQAKTWVNQKLRYTHGYGVAASPVAKVVGEGLPDYIVRDIPPTGSIEVKQPGIYFGEVEKNYVLAPSAQPEFDFPQGTDNANTSYSGTHGVRMDGNARALWSLRTGDFNLLISDQIQNRTQILFRRNLDDRLKAIAPFLSYDPQPYIVIADGRLYWIVDAYTTANTYPYSQIAPDGENYIRNSVKVVIDAYEGTPEFYVADPKDPILKAYSAAFPGLFKPIDRIPVSLQSHLRVPEYLFATQSDIYRTYHISNAQTFYNREDVWDFPIQQNKPLPPYYVLLRLPDEKGAEYLQILPFTPRGKNNMIAWLAARNDPPHYGELVSYVLSKDVNIFGPQQISSRINATPEISKDVSLLNQNGSQVIFGNLLVVPVGNSFLYFQPLYLRASGGSQNIPELKKVILADKDRVAYADTLQLAIDQLVGKTNAPSPGPSPNPSPGGPTPSPGAGGGQTELTTQALQHYNAAQDALKRGDFATYGDEIKQLGAILSQLAAASGSPLPAVSPSPSPGASPRPSPRPSP